MNISDVAKKTGLTSKTIRFYEEKALITAPIRSDNGYRHYSAKHVEELTLLRQARQVGFNLDECRELVALFNDPARHSADVKARPSCTSASGISRSPSSVTSRAVGGVRSSNRSSACEER